MTVRLKKLYPVIHCIDPSVSGGFDHAIENVRCAQDNRADGAILIGHGLDHFRLREIYLRVRESFPLFWLGVNFLDLPIGDRLSGMAEECPMLNGLWMDGCPGSRLLLPNSIRVFGGVAFKYRQPDLSGQELKVMCERAIKFVDIITTSGDKTGSPPSVEKLMEIRKYIGEKNLLAVASGVSANNISSFIEYADKFIVSTSISQKVPRFGNLEYLNPERVRELADLIHG